MLDPHECRITCSRCEDDIHGWQAVYRCYDCDLPFHKGCLIDHCEDAGSDERLRRLELFETIRDRYGDGTQVEMLERAMGRLSAVLEAVKTDELPQGSNRLPNAVADVGFGIRQLAWLIGGDRVRAELQGQIEQLRKMEGLEYDEEVLDAYLSNDDASGS